MPAKTAKTTAKRLIIEWSEQLRTAVDMAISVRTLEVAPYLFCTRNGDSYARGDGSTDSWKTMWQRFMKRVLAETKVTERFTEHDLRAKAGSDAESLEEARKLLAHVDSRTTREIYRRKPERIRPAR